MRSRTCTIGAFAVGVCLFAIVCMRACMCRATSLGNEVRSMKEECFDKCIHRIKKEPELVVGEMACVDRCVSKYLEVHDKVGEVFKKVQASMQQQ